MQRCVEERKKVQQNQKWKVVLERRVGLEMVQTKVVLGRLELDMDPHKWLPHPYL